MNDDVIRGQFEYWAAPQGLRLHRRDSPGSTRLGQYCADDTQLAFEAFRAALSHAAGQEVVGALSRGVPEGK